jgi:hypothetical protein
MKLLTFIILLTLQFTHTAKAGGGTWSEFGDAPSFPDGQAQITSGAGDLTLLLGSTFPTSDPRNAYCIKITDPANFRVTADNAIDNTANTDFDTSLYLFDKQGKPLLFNDDTPPSAASTLTSVTTDGSGFSLTQSGEYILVVAGFPDKPLDNIANNLFVAGSSTVNSANQNAGLFQVWENNNPATGSYILAVQGAEFCQDQLDVISTNSSATDSSLCFGDDQGNFKSCNDNSSTSGKDDIAIGYFNKDKYFDVMFDKFGDSPTLCLGSNKDGFDSCNNLDIGVTNTSDVAMADLDGNGNVDVVFSNSNGLNQVCMGDGITGFSCGNVSGVSANYQSVALGDLNGDNILDVVFGAAIFSRICYGVGDGTFTGCHNDNKMALNQVKLGEFRDFSQWLEISDAPSFPNGQAQVKRPRLVALYIGLYQFWQW